MIGLQMIYGLRHVGIIHHPQCNTYPVVLVLPVAACLSYNIPEFIISNQLADSGLCGVINKRLIKSKFHTLPAQYHHPQLIHLLSAALER